MNEDKEFIDGKMLPDMQHKIKITLTWHKCIDSLADYMTYKNLYNTKKASSFNLWVTSLMSLAGLIINDIDSQEIFNLISKFNSGSMLTHNELINLHNYISKRLNHLGLIDLKIEKVSPAQKYAGMFK